ncbi:amino acid ABC transporter permease [Candidatus Pelagibacter communis]|uniref:amino acid ABC transporter permease n=1 Tax=Pelagibacter ubique TaxID=198252 RepID=UPI00094CDBCB|nr:ABC transporter permease subunit [Candidatus Pelagibacter ubique]
MNNKIKRIIPQLLTILFVVFVFGFFTFNAQVNMDNRGIDFGFGFLKQEASFDMQFTLLDYDGQDSYLWAYVVALLNTLLVSFLGIIFCTILGVIIGVARLSSNYLIRNSAAWYVEFFRNIPLLLQIFFWYYAALRALPLPEGAEPWFGVTYMTIKGYYIPAMIWQNLNIFMYCLIAAVVSIVFIRIYAKKLQEKEGKQLPLIYISLAILIILPGLSFLVGGVTLNFEIPVLKQLATTSYIYEGGVRLPPELIALVLALSLYTSTFVAECVRAGIQGISKGQKEAAASVGLTPNQILKLIIMPQALRIIIPPTTNQYLNLTKNSSLAAAIAYPDLVLVFAGTALMQTGKAIEIVGITMLTYLSISLAIAALMNWYNKKIEIKEK